MEGANRRLTELEKNDEIIQKNIDALNKNIIDNNEKINNEILFIKEKIEFLSGIDFDELKDINIKLSELENMDKIFQNTINEIQKDINDLKNNIPTEKLYWLYL